jgi:hypothetical protein
MISAQLNKLNTDSVADRVERYLSRMPDDPEQLEQPHGVEEISSFKSSTSDEHQNQLSEQVNLDQSKSNAQNEDQDKIPSSQPEISAESDEQEQQQVQTTTVTQVVHVESLSSSSQESSSDEKSSSDSAESDGLPKKKVGKA